ncbi:hypothetical protein P9139_18900 [Curtobacterium flaccumfaciens]|nr:hypothetical protein P9139_18900 [Curtobacterium flaccumfaciens]
MAEHLQDTKLEDVSVRSLGRVLGTSAYPIVYHFGTRESLIEAVVDHLAETVANVTLEADADDLALSSYLVAVFGGLHDPERSLAARLAFELGSVESLDGHDRERTFHREQIAAISAWCVAHGYSASDAERAARGAVLAARGVQWGAIVDREHTNVDGALRRVADKLVAGVHFAAA